MTLLAQAAGDGRITLEEHAHRVQRAYTARTLGDLAGLTDDLALPGAQPLRLDNSRAVTAFFATERRSGRWVVPDRLVVTAIGGQVVLDLREALLQARRTVMYVSAMGGQVNLLVPAGVTVVTRNLSASLPGARPDPQPEPVVPPGSPVIEMHTLTVLGRIHVRTPRPPRGSLFSRRPR
ncbi:MAG: hypothetical protein JWL68_4511 [Actinomycetia bacterium]|nr:hypothetical protein [Actinomycetes bacterium]